MEPETITAISSLWPYTITIPLTLFIALFHRQIRRFLETITTVQARWGDREVSASRELRNEDSSSEPASQSAVPAIREKALTEPAEEVLSEEVIEAEEAEPETSETLFNNMIQAFLQNDVEHGEEIYARLQAAEGDAAKKVRNQALHLHLQYRSGNTDALEGLKNLATEVESTPASTATVYNFIGMSYDLSNDFLRAKQAYDIAAENAPKESARTEYLLSSANRLFDSGERDDAYRRITSEIGNVSNDESLFKLWKGLGLLLQKAEDLELGALAVQRALSYEPSDTDTLFDAAYWFSDADLHSLAIFHYHTLLGFRPKHAASLNNLGVQYNRVGLVGRSIDLYEESFEEGNTLAAANLAYEQMRVGFFEEAENVLRRAREHEDVHLNVAKASADVAERQETESKRVTDISQAGQEERQFLLPFAEAYFVESDLPNLEVPWRFSDETEAEVSKRDNKLRIVWKRNNSTFRILATLKNRGAKIMTYAQEDSYRKLLDKGYLYLTEDYRHIQIMIIADNKPTFLTLQTQGEST